MRKAINRSLIGGIFSNRNNAKKAIQALRDLGVPDQDIVAVVMLNDEQAFEACTDALASEGLAEAQAVFYDKATQIGRVLVAVQSVRDPTPVIAVFDDNRAEYNGSLASLVGPVQPAAGIVGPWLRIAPIDDTRVEGPLGSDRR